MYKNHNDFLENFAETGIFGGVLFIGIFLLIFSRFIRAFFKAKKGEDESYKWLFLPAFGLFCYSFDALFNFPADRPEIAAFFALFVGAGIAFSPSTMFKKLEGKNVTRHASRVTMILFFTLLLGTIYILHLNFESLKLQRIAKQELLSGVLTTRSEVFVAGFPSIPDIGCEGVPIAVVKGRYLIVEGKYQQALDILKQDHASPYDTRPEFFISVAYAMLGQPDSALAYTNRVYALKPYFSKNISVMASALESKGKLKEALQVLDDHVALNSKDGIPIEGVIYQQQTGLREKLK
jgi:tetratricopeptide (TPR) repeat protein